MRVGEGGADEVLADGDFEAVFRDPHGVNGREPELEYFQGGFVGGNDLAVATLEEVGGVSMPVDAGAVPDAIFVSDVPGFAPGHESEFDPQTIAVAAYGAFASVASGES
jgi:hypothetical protein